MTTEKTSSMITRNIPEKLRRDFKSKCAAEGTSQQDKIIELIREYVDGVKNGLIKIGYAADEDVESVAGREP